MNLLSIVNSMQARYSLSDAEALELLAQLAFDRPGIPTTTCPF